MQLLSEPKT